MRLLVFLVLRIMILSCRLVFNASEKLVAAPQRRSAQTAAPIRNCSLTSAPFSFLSGNMIQGTDPLGLVGVRGISNSVGYSVIDSVKIVQASQTSNQACHVQMAQVINKHGTAVPASAAGAQASVRAMNFNDATQAACPGFGLCANIWDLGDKDVYPISTLTYIIVTKYNSDADCPKMRIVYDYIKWVLTDPAANAVATAVGFATMPKKIAEMAQTQVLDTMTCGSGNTFRYVKDEPVPSVALVVKGSGSSLQAVLQGDLLLAYTGAGFYHAYYVPLFDLISER